MSRLDLYSNRSFIMYCNNVLSFIHQEFMCAPNATTSCSPATPSMSTHHPGQPSQRPSTRTVCLNMRRGPGRSRYSLLHSRMISLNWWMGFISPTMKLQQVVNEPTSERDFLGCPNHFYQSLMSYSRCYVGSVAMDWAMSLWMMDHPKASLASEYSAAPWSSFLKVQIKL